MLLQVMHSAPGLFVEREATTIKHVEAMFHGQSFWDEDTYCVTGDQDAV